MVQIYLIKSVLYFVVAVVRVSWHNRHIFHWVTDIEPTAGRNGSQRYGTRAGARAAVEVGVVVQRFCAVRRIA